MHIHRFENEAKRNVFKCFVMNTNRAQVLFVGYTAASWGFIKLSILEPLKTLTKNYSSFNAQSLFKNIC